MRVTIDLEAPETWPDDLLAYLSSHHDLFLDWESGPTNVTGQEYDQAIYGLNDILQQYVIIGWHCTRLTEREAATILSDGMEPPNAAMLRHRIDNLLEDGLITEAVANRLKAENQAHEENRAGRIWFYFFPPRLDGESGISCFFRFWGGESLYNSHDHDRKTGVVIRSIGVPCLVEAEIPIACLGPVSGLCFKIARKFLISRGYRTIEPVDHADRITLLLPADKIRRIVRFQEADFAKLTGCDNWKDPLR